MPCSSQVLDRRREWSRNLHSLALLSRERSLGPCPATSWHSDSPHHPAVTSNEAVDAAHRHESETRNEEKESETFSVVLPQPPADLDLDETSSIASSHGQSFQ